MVRRIIKIFASIMIALVVIVILAAAGGHFYLKTDHAKNMIKTQVNNAIPGHIDWTDANISVLGGRVAFEGLTISGPDNGPEKQDNILSSNRVFMDVSLLNLLRGKIVVVADLDQPHLLLARDQDGHLNILRAFIDPSDEEVPQPEPEDMETEFPFSIILKSVTVSGGTFKFLDHPSPDDETGGEIFLADINVKIDDADLERLNGRGFIGIGNGMIDMGGIRIPLSEFHFESLLDNGRIEPILVDIRLKGENGGPQLVLTGGASDVFDQPTFDLELNASAELSDIKRMVSLDIPLSGSMAIALSADGSPENPAMRLDAHYGGGNIAGIDFEEIDLKSSLADLSVDISRFITRINGSILDLSGTIDLKDAFKDGLLAAPTNLDALSYNLLLDGENIDFDKLVWTTPYLSGIADALIRIDGTGIFPSTLDAKIDGTINGTKIAVGAIFDPVDPEIVLKGSIKEGTVHAAPLELAIKETRLRVTGDYAISDNLLDIDINLDTPNMAQFLEPLGVQTVSSEEASLVGTFSGPVAKPEIKARVDSKNLVYDDIRIGDVYLTASFDKSGRVAIERLFTDNRGSQITITGHLELFENGFSGFKSDIPAELTAVLEEVSVPDFFPDIDLSGTFGGRIDLTEKITDPFVGLSLQGSTLAYGETHIGDIESEITLSDGTALIKQLILENQQSMIRLTGSADLFVPGSLSLLPAPKLDLEFPESTIAINDFVEAASGRITMKGHAKGQFNDLVAELSIIGSNLEAAGHFIGDLTATAGLADGRLILEPLRIVNEDSELLMTGGVDLFAPSTFDIYEDPAIDFEITGDAIYIENFVPDWSGLMSVSAKVNGSLGDPRGDIEINGKNIDLGIQYIDSMQVSSLLKDKTIFFDPVRITLTDGESIRANGHFSFDRQFALEIDSDEISLARIGVLEDSGLTGTMAIEASGKGLLDDPSIQGEILLSELMMEQIKLEPMTVAVDIDDRVAKAVATSNFVISSRYSMDTGDFELDGKFDDTLLDPFLLPAGLTGLSGNITAYIAAEGNIDEPAQAAAHLDINRMILFQSRNRGEPIELIRIEGLSADYEEGSFSIPENDILLLETSSLTISGGGHMDDDFELFTEGSIPLMVVSMFAPDLKDLQGSIDLSGKIHQDAGLPDFDVKIQLRDLGLTIPTLMQSLHQVNGRIDLTSDGITLENIRGRLDTGDFTAKGTIALEEDFTLGMADISLDSRALPIRYPGIIELTLNSRLNFTGTPGNTRLSGQILLIDGLYYKDVEISLIGEVTRRRRAAPPATAMPDFNIPYLKNLDLDIDINYRQPLMVDNNIALMTLRPEIRVNGTLNRPGITGRAEVNRGTVSYQNIEFDIDRGIIDFIDPYRIQPEIDIRARSNVRQWTITLEVTGTPEDLQFNLTSNPPEEHADILSLLLFGQTTREMAEGTGPAGPSPEEMLVNMLAGRVEEDIRAGTGLDIVEFEYTRPGGSENDEGVRVTLGKELSRRLTVTYGLERKAGEIVQQHTAIYRVLEFLAMRAFQDTAGTYGGEMRFRLEFR